MLGLHKWGLGTRGWSIQTPPELDFIDVYFNTMASGSKVNHLNKRYSVFHHGLAKDRG